MDKLKQEITAKEYENVNFNAHKARKMPDFEKKAAAVKLNTAAIVWEEAQLQRKEEEQAKVLKDFEYNLWDDSEYNRWVDEMKEKEEVETIEHWQKVKIEMEMAREEAIEAWEQKHRENRVQAEKLKVEG